MSIRIRIREMLGGRAIRGGMVLGVGSGAENMLRFLRNIILARILAPEAFGAMAIVLSVNALLESFTEVGIKEAIIQNPKGVDRRFLNGAWWLALGRATALFGAAFIAAPHIARFYGIPDLSALMRVAFLTILFNGTMSSGAYVAIKRMDFKRWILLYHGGAAVGILATICLSFWMRNVWALAIGFAVEAGARALLSYVVCPFQPGFDFDRESMRSLLRYSKGMIGLPILTFVFLRADIFVLGKFVTVEQLGFYSMAVALARIPSQFVTSIASRLVMPMFAEVQRDTARINDMVQRMTSPIILFFAPPLFFIAFYGGNVLAFFYGSRYSIAAVPFAIVFAAELLRTGSVPIVAFYLGSGRPGLHRLFACARAVLMIVLIYPAVKAMGIVGAAMAGLVATTTAYILQVCLVRKITGLDLKKYGMAHLYALAISLCVVICWLIVQVFPSTPKAAQVASGVVGMLLSYALAFKHLANNRNYTPAK